MNIVVTLWRSIRYSVGFWIWMPRPRNMALPQSSQIASLLISVLGVFLLNETKIQSGVFFLADSRVLSTGYVRRIVFINHLTRWRVLSAAAVDSLIQYIHLLFPRLAKFPYRCVRSWSAVAWVSGSSNRKARIRYAAAIHFSQPMRRGGLGVAL